MNFRRACVLTVVAGLLSAGTANATHSTIPGINVSASYAPMVVNSGPLVRLSITEVFTGELGWVRARHNVRITTVYIGGKTYKWFVIPRSVKIAYATVAYVGVNNRRVYSSAPWNGGLIPLRGFKAVGNSDVGYELHPVRLDSIYLTAYDNRFPVPSIGPGKGGALPGCDC